MKKFKKAAIALTLGTMLLGSTAVQAAEGTNESYNQRNNTAYEQGLSYSNEATNIDTVTTITVYNNLFIVSGEPNEYGPYEGDYGFPGSYVKGGKWMKNGKGWWYQFPDGSYPTNASIIISNENAYSISSWTDYNKYNKSGTRELTQTIDILYDGSYVCKEYTVTNGTDTTSNSKTTTVGKNFKEKVYTFDEKGYLITSKFVWNHWIDANGVMRIRTGKNGEWKQNKKGWWYLLEDGSYLKDGFYVIYNNRLVKYGSFTDKGKVYYFDKNGYAVTSSFVQTRTSYGVGHSTSDGVSAGTSVGRSTSSGTSTNSGQSWGESYGATGNISDTISQNQSYGKNVGSGTSYGSSTSVSTGTNHNVSYNEGTSQGYSYSNTYNWVNKNGIVDTDTPYSWQKDSTGWWFGTIKGFSKTQWYAKNQWLKLDGKWYYFNASGYMVTGTQKIDGKTYQFGSNGAWLGK